jgi:hypothetical protein
MLQIPWKMNENERFELKHVAKCQLALMNFGSQLTSWGPDALFLFWIRVQSRNHILDVISPLLLVKRTFIMEALGTIKKMQNGILLTFSGKT